MINLLLFSMLNIAVTIAPIKGIVEEIGGSHFNYETIYPLSANPHIYEVRPGDIMKVKKASLFIYSGRAEPGGKKLCQIAKKCVSLEKMLSVKKTTNPHIWLNPILVKGVIDSISSLFGTLEPEFSDTFMHNAAYTKSVIDTILNEVHNAKGKSVILIHSAFEPLFKEMGFDVLIVSKEPGREPGARRIKELSDEIKKKNVVLGVCETGRSCKIVKGLSKRYKFKVIELNPLYTQNFTDFLKNAVITIENATNSSK